MTNSVFCTTKTVEQAENIVQELKGSGFSNDDISALLPDKRGTKDFAHEHNTKAPEGATTGGIAGLGVGAAVGWLAGIGALAIPGVGPFIAAGPIMAALGGAALGTATGGIIGALVGLGIPEFEAKRYDAKIREGNILISVHAEDNKLRDVAKEVFERNNANDISSASEASVS
ncbi:MAG: complement resistance protein TraT [Pseudomonadota bacterium]|nr:complement resistance protein TraT [Pseudomonadota bacterium]